MKDGTNEGIVAGEIYRQILEHKHNNYENVRSLADQYTCFRESATQHGMKVVQPHQERKKGNT